MHLPDMMKSEREDDIGIQNGSAVGNKIVDGK
jgi:hypothetical protein